MDDRQRDEQRTDEQPDALEDLDVNEAHAEQVKGGKNNPVVTYSIVNAWPKKYSG